MIYLEELRRGPEFIDAVKEITCGAKPTPILVIKSGRTESGAAAAASHTGSLAGTEGVYDAIFKQAGILRVDNIDELFDYAKTFASKTHKNGSPKILNGNRLAIVTNAGGPGIVGKFVCVLRTGSRVTNVHNTHHLCLDHFSDRHDDIYWTSTCKAKSRNGRDIGHSFAQYCQLAQSH